MSIFVEKPGILTTVQDLGRRGSQKFGINPSGAMDPFAAECANLLVGSAPDEAVLEMHFPAPRIVFRRDAVFSITGADFVMELDGEPVDVWRSHGARAGSTLSASAKRSGERCYLAIAGGLIADEWLGSRSTNLTVGLGGYNGRALAAGDVLELGPEPGIVPGLAVSPNALPRYHNFPTLRILPGSEFEVLSTDDRTALVNTGFTVTSRSDRMGFRLDGPALNACEMPQMISSAAAFGTVQLLPDGQLILLMADHQTTGGYPRLAHVISADLPLAAQLGPNSGLGFHMVTIREAERLALKRRQDLSFLRVGCRLLSKR